MADYTDKKRGQPLRADNLKLYRAWVRMCRRCNNPEDADFKSYGARGIRVYQRWQGEDGFSNLVEYLGPPPGPEYTIDRYPDNDGHYEPGNVRWATRTDQANNRRSSVYINHRGHRLSIAEWAKAMNIDRRVLHKRIKSGWDLERALSPFPFDQDSGKIAA